MALHGSVYAWSIGRYRDHSLSYPRHAVAALALVSFVVSGCASSEERPSFRVGEPVAAPRRERSQLVAFRAAPAETPRYELVLAGAGGEEIRVLVGGRAAGRPLRPALFQPAAWSPDGRRLAFAVQLGGVFARGREIYSMRLGGSRARRLTRGGFSGHPVWSPDGRPVYFAREGPLEPVGDSGARRRAASIWSMRPDGSDKLQITSPASARYDIPGSFSPDGQMLAFTRETHVEPGDHGRAANTGEIWVMRPDGSGQEKRAERSRDPAFSPDGRRIAFASDRDENGSLSYGDRTFFANELYLMNRDGSGPRRLTRTRALNERQPSWLPSGARIAYQRGESFQNGEATVIVEANADGSCARTLLGSRRPAIASPRYAAPTWRPGPTRDGDRRLSC